ncbi:MAG: hypothetical protein AB7T32_04740 [Dehalococcoidia bacterium]
MEEYISKDPALDLNQWRRRVHAVDSNVHELREHVAEEHQAHDGMHHLADVLLHHHHTEQLHDSERRTG